WKFEIDDQLFRRRKWKLDELTFDTDHVGSPEYLAKRAFMARLVRLLHSMGAPELARQYEWWTAKSQPNVLKRLDATDGPADGLMGIDFRAGLALLPFLPMSPADVKLIVKGLFRGNLVQFDRGDLKQLSEFVENHKSLFQDLRPALEELYQVEPAYRRSLPDITHHGIRLITDRSLRRSVAHGLIEGWQRRDLVDEDHAQRLKKSSLTFALFYVTGVLPLLGRFIRRIWGNARYARHLKKVFTSWNYFRRTLRAKQAEKLIDWYRDGRVNDQRAMALVERPVRFWTQRFLVSWLPPKWHRFLTEPSFAWSTIKEAVQYPIRFYRDAEFREQWLTEQVMAGYEEGMLTNEEKDRILERVKDPFIQKYLKCVAVHICTLPVTQVVSVILAIYAMIRFGNTWQESMAYAVGVLAFFQATPVSPGSITRGSYVLYLMIKERNWRDYWVAALVSFWHYIGYLGFPLQMVTKFPSLSRLMAGRWATSMVRIIPVFGERGALLEHWVFDLFFNLPLSLRRKWKKE
ncbi:MAG: hypothetical protein ONB05_07310, partial [candidate division KSB1 bacterium]|nr:hypothetical protein [candidate division KSB1 bacterium]